MAHEIPYVATATVAGLRDLEYKVQRAMEFRGARYLHVLVPCPLGWGSALRRHHQDRPAGRADRAVPGVRGRSRRGHQRHADPQPGAGRGVPAAAGPVRAPVQWRTSPAAAPTERSPRLPGRCADRNIASDPACADAAAQPTERRPGEGQAVRHHAEPRFQPRQQDRLLADRAARLRRPDAAVQQRLPGRREHPAVALPRRGWHLRGRLAADHAGQPAARDHGPGLLPAVRDRVQPRRSSTPPSGINSVERFLGDEAIRQGWTVPSPRRDTGKRVLIVGAGPSGLSAAYHLRLLGHQVTLRDSAVWAGGMMRYGIPAYRLPRDVLDAEVGRILAMGVTWEGGRQVTDIEAAMADGGFDAAFLAVGAQKGKRAYIPAGDSARILDAVSLLHAMEGARAAAARPPGRDLRRRQHRDGRGQDRPAARRHRRRRRLPAHQGQDAGPRRRGRGGDRGRRADDVALHHRQGRRGQARHREDGARRDRLPAADRRVHRARRRRRRAGARPGGRAVPAGRRARRHDRTTAWSRSART